MAIPTASELTVVATESDVALPRLLAAIGATFECRPPTSLGDGLHDEGGHRRAAIISEDNLISLWKGLGGQGARLLEALQAFQHVLLCPFSATAEGMEIVRGLTSARIRPADLDSASEYSVHGTFESCDVFAGLKFGPIERRCDRGLIIEEGTNHAESIVTMGGASLFARFDLGNLALFVNSCTELFDTTGQYSRNLSAAGCFSKLVPLILFLRQAGVPLPQTARRWANWIIDDPNLKSRYGFINTKDLAECVIATGAAVTIGFIPWNHRRTNAGVVNLFRKHWPRLAICVHGCDHSGSEFATETTLAASQLLALAETRMQDMQARTSLPFENVMVFPQGKFSRAAMCALRDSTLLAAVNTELIDSRTKEGISAGELLQPAITSYEGFPLFLRRPAEEPLANFALDLFLGKPCLIVTHHEYFKGGTQPLASMVESLNQLDRAMTWTNLENGIAGTYSIKRTSSESSNVRLYCSTSLMRLDHPGERICFAKSEPRSARLPRVLCNGEELSGTTCDGDLTFEHRVAGNQPIRIEISSSSRVRVSLPSRSAKRELKIATRRYLCEFRDNYIDRLPRVKAGIKLIQNLVDGRA